MASQHQTFTCFSPAENTASDITSKNPELAAIRFAKTLDVEHDWSIDSDSLRVLVRLGAVSSEYRVTYNRGKYQIDKPDFSQCVWKFPLHVQRDAFDVDMPENAKILSVQKQPAAMAATDRKVMLWALVNPQGQLVKRTFQWFETGQTIPGVLNLRRVETIQFDGGEVVFHLFEVCGS